MSAHTPGPWHVSDDIITGATDGVDVMRHVGGELECIAADLRSLADARLIAAAPDLLAALKQMISKAESLDESWVFDLDAATAAVEKAEGK